MSRQSRRRRKNAAIDRRYFTADERITELEDSGRHAEAAELIHQIMKVNYDGEQAGRTERQIIQDVRRVKAEYIVEG